MLYTIAELIYTVFITSLLMWIIFTALPHISPDKKKLAWFLCMILISSIFSIKASVFAAVVILIVTIGLISEKPLANMLLATISYIISVLYNYVFFVFWHWLTGITQSELADNFKQQSVFYLFFYPSLYLLLRLLRGFFEKFKIPADRHFKTLRLCVFCILLTCIALITSFISYEYANNYPDEIVATNLKYFILLFFMLVILFFIVTIMLKNYVKMEYKLKESSHLKQYTDEVENMYLSLRGFKHDYTNILCSLKYYIDTQSYENLNSYFINHVYPITRSFDDDEHIFEQLLKIKIPEIKSILYFKILEAEKANVNISIESRWIIDKIEVNPVDITRILGILIDNAIEGAVSTNNISTKPTITITFIKSNNVVTIIVSNPVEKNFDISSLKRDGYSTKNGEHGFGLKNIRSIICKYNNILMSTICKNNILDQIIEISDT